MIFKVHLPFPSYPHPVTMNTHGARPRFSNITYQKLPSLQREMNKMSLQLLLVPKNKKMFTSHVKGQGVIFKGLPLVSYGNLRMK